MMDHLPRGLIIALVTPFDERGNIDWPSLRRLIDRALPFCDALFLGEGLVGEGLSLPNPMRLELLQGSREAIGGKKPLLLCPTASSAEETLSNVAAAGKDFPNRPGEGSFFWVDIPLWYHSNRKLPQFYLEWAKYTPFPIFLYNHPHLISRLNRSLKRNNIRTSVLKRLSENEQIVGLIQAGDFRRTLHYQSAVRARRDFRFYDGEEKTFLNGPSSSGVVSSGANLLPAEWSEIVNASLNLPEDPERNFLLFKKSQKLRELNQVLRADPARSLKMALQRLGTLPQERGLRQISSESSEADLRMENFLRENFSLQLPS